MKRGSTPRIIRKMQIKTTMRHHFTLIRMAIIKKSKKKTPQYCKVISLQQIKNKWEKKSKNNKFWRGYREKGTLLHYWWK